jgi:hypothetical protein
MADSPKELAERAIAHASDDVAAFILSSAEERARGHHATSIALDQRAAQTAGFLMAAAAVAATASVAPGGAWVHVLSGASAVSFAAGACLAFRAVRSDVHHPPGLPPAWWRHIVDHEEFSLRDARCWAAGAIEQMLETNAAEDRKRGDHLNLALRYGVAGAVLIVVAAVPAMFG